MSDEVRTPVANVALVKCACGKSEIVMSGDLAVVSWLCPVCPRRPKLRLVS